jgi:hypothetical protein
LATPARGLGANALNAPPMSAAEEIQQTYAPAMTGATPAAAPMATPAAAPMAGAPTADAEATRARITALRQEAARTGDKRFSAAADELKKVLDLTDASIDPTKRFINLGEQGVFDVVTRQRVEGTARKPKVGTPVPVMTPEGNVEYVSPEKAIGMTPGSQAPTAAERAKLQKVEKGRNAVDEILTKIGGYYAELDKLRGVPSTERNVFSNVAAYSGAAMPFVGRATGSKEQQLRDQITQIRSALVREIKNATNMSAQELNSNVELQLALEAATDPMISIQANAETLRNLSTLYGEGKLADGQNQPATQAAGGTITVTAPDGQVIEFDSQEAADKFKQAMGQ